MLPASRFSNTIARLSKRAVKSGGRPDRTSAQLGEQLRIEYLRVMDVQQQHHPDEPDWFREQLGGRESIAALHGASLGGGLEVAIACHWRIASTDAKLGLPEVNLGLLPGSGGTQRAPRLVGAKVALDLMLSGRHAGADEALAWGMVDQVVAPDALEAASVTFAQEVVDRKMPPRPTRAATHGLADEAGNRAAVRAAREATKKKSRGLLSPSLIVDAVEAALDKPFDEGVEFERAAFLRASDSPQRAGLVHAFFAERQTAKAPEIRNSQPRPLGMVGVIGGGTMGAGIAVSFIDAGMITNG